MDRRQTCARLRESGIFRVRERDGVLLGRHDAPLEPALARAVRRHGLIDVEITRPTFDTAPAGDVVDRRG